MSTQPKSRLLAVFALVAIASLAPWQAAAATAKPRNKATTASRAPAGLAGSAGAGQIGQIGQIGMMGGQSSATTLEVKGQSRAWSQMVRARGEKDSVNFVETRKDYHTEIEATRF